MNQFALRYYDALSRYPLMYSRLDIVFWPARNEQVDVVRSCMEVADPLEQGIAPSILPIEGIRLAHLVISQASPTCCIISSNSVQSVSRLGCFMPLLCEVKQVCRYRCTSG